MDISADTPALLGGLPIRREGPPAWPPHDPEVLAAIQEAAERGAWGRYFGPAGERLNRQLAEFHKIPHVWFTSSGTAAVEIALRGVGVQAGDEVLLAAYDFKANFMNVLALGGTPVLVDVRDDDWQLDAPLAAKSISPRTKAVVASHLHGGTVDMPALRSLCSERGIPLVEDACQCPGIEIHGRPAGTWGDVGVLSFGGSKLTTAGRGGALLTADRQIVERIRRHVLRGNDLSPLSELQAAALVPQWERLTERHCQRNASVKFLLECLGDNSGLRPLAIPDGLRHRGYYKVGFEYQSELFGGLPRATFCRAMRAEGVAFSPGFRSLHRIHAARRFRAGSPLTVADRVDEAVVVLHHPVLLEDATRIREVARAVARVRRFSDQLKRLPVMPDEEYGWTDE